MYYQERLECMAREEKRALQSERLISTVKLVYESVPAYRKKMDLAGVKPCDIKSISDIVKLPFTTKQDLRDGYPFGMFSADMEDIVRVHASSGTTGKLTVVGYTENDIKIWAECCARSLAGAGGTKKSLLHVAYGYGLFTGGLGLHYGGELLGLSVVPVSSGNTARQIQLLKDFKTDIICCTPSYAVFLADELEKAGVDPKELSLKSGLFGAEPWTEEMRKDIEKRLNLKAYDIYGLSEILGPGVAGECEKQSGCHIWDDHFYPEIVHEKTLKPLADGKAGELVFTTLTKEGIPLIRYRTRDITAITNEPCPCGRTSPRIKRIAGRSDDMLIIRGVNIFPSQIESVLMSADSRVAPHYHIITDRVNNLDILEIEVELNDGANFDEIKTVEEITKKLTVEIASAISVVPKVRLVSTGSIKRSEGKSVRVTDRRKS
ncbi:MAG: phenylacetate--CoA ligase [Firmicutes bacterium]|nr:phenylacetate--CoA ligase [Bacillota bacterium]